MTSARGLMLVWTDIPPAMEPAFDEWYVRRHMPERILGVPGFLLGRRFRALTGGPRHLALYELASTAVLQTEPYHALRRTRDPESRQLMPGFRNTVKAVGAVTAEAGEGEGGVIALAPLVQTADGNVMQDLLRDFAARPGIVRVRHVVNDEHAQAAIRTHNTRPGDRFIDAFLLVEALDAEHLHGVHTPGWEARLESIGAIPDGQPATLSLRFAIRSSG